MDHRTLTIGVFDSGIGGLSVANAVLGELPGHSLIYVADNAYAPYGPRPGREIVARSRRIVDFLLRRGCGMIVVACNTATAVAIDELRALHPEVPFVGLEPAVKPASRVTRVGVMATRATLDSERYGRLRRTYLAERPVWESDCKGLVELIEAYPSNHPKLTDYLEQLLSDRPKLDAMVLGCTHYPLVKDAIAEVVGPDVLLIDPAPAAARQAARLAGDGETAKHPYCDLYTTRGSAALQRTIVRLPKLNGIRRWVRPELNQ